MQVNYDLTSLPGQTLASPAAPAKRHKARRDDLFAASATRALTDARREALRDDTVENVIWIVIAMSAAVLIIMSIALSRTSRTSSSSPPVLGVQDLSAGLGAPLHQKTSL